MILGITSLQRNRGPWLAEWFAFHHMLGFNRFYFYAHLCTDNTFEVLAVLGRKLEIQVIPINDTMDQVQLVAYMHACKSYINEVDWMAFIDGDEFLFPTQCNWFPDALLPYASPSISAIGVYNVTFGSSNHLIEPKGLITENFRHCNSSPTFMPNRRIKSIVKGHQQVVVTSCGNFFNTPGATVDEDGRQITWGYPKDHIPTYRNFRFNHYVCQSYEFFKSFKQYSGHADASASTVRGEGWWKYFDQNVDYDTSLERFATKLKETISWLLTEP